MPLTTKFKSVVLSLTLAALVGCAANRPIDLTKIKIGMTKEEVTRNLGRKPDNVIGSKEFPIGRIDVLQYTRIRLEYADERYWLYFLNDTLRQWGRPGDWAREADNIYELRIR